MRFLVSLLTACVVLTACGGDAAKESASTQRGKAAATTEGPPGAPATLTKRLDFASCLAEDLADDAAQSSRCPSFALLSLDYMGSQCTASGGTLKARQPSQAWSLDVDGDASAEVLVDLVANFDCEGVPGVFGCGSGGCPFLLFKRRGDTWVELGTFNADDGPGISVLPAEEGKYATLRGGCTGLLPCSEFTHYEWNGSAYKRTWIAFKGHPVDVAAGRPHDADAGHGRDRRAEQEGPGTRRIPGRHHRHPDRHGARCALFVRLALQCLPARIRRDGAPQEAVTAQPRLLLGLLAAAHHPRRAEAVIEHSE